MKIGVDDLTRPLGLTWGSVIQMLSAPARSLNRPTKMFFAICDHYEPMWGEPPMSVRDDRVRRWTDGYPELCRDIEDSRGRPPQHSFFYPAEEYHAPHLESLAKLCHDGWGDVEVHLHHDNDTADNLRETLCTFRDTLVNEHGLLKVNESGEATYGFIHGNWALDNSRSDGRWCGVSNELDILLETGCYADFTMPSLAFGTQTRTINSIYYAKDDPEKPKSHDRGVAARVGTSAPKDQLLLIQGPLAFDWSRRKFGVVPKIENADLHGSFPPTLSRLGNWLKAGVSIQGREDWLFVKLHTHGAPEKNADMLLGDAMRQFHQDLARFAQEHDHFQYYYVTAREMADLVHQAEGGAEEPNFD